MDWLTWLRGEWDRFLGWGLAAAGAVLLLIGVVEVSRARYLADQLSFIMSAGIGGLGCLGFGAGLLLSADLHDEWRKLDRLADILVQSPVTARPPAVDTVPGPLPEQEPGPTLRITEPRAARSL